jgi:ribosomal protein S18 acetylase RimI-like enzyme
MKPKEALMAHSIRVSNPSRKPEYHPASTPDLPRPRHDGEAVSRSGFSLTRDTTREDVPFEIASALLIEHGELMRGRLLDHGGPVLDVAAHAASFWAKFDEVLPPNGSYYLATNSRGAIVGTGAMRRVSPEAAEMKHLYVRPVARRSGLGRALVERRMADARAMGLRTLLADTLPNNVEMIRLYTSLGFRIVPPFSESGSIGVQDDLRDHFTFLRLDMPSET